MIDTLQSLGLNLVFWGGVYASLPRWQSAEPITRVFEAAVVGFALIVVSLEFMGLTGRISLPFVAAVCAAAGAWGAIVRFRRRRVGTETSPANVLAERWSMASNVALALAVWAAIVSLLIGLVLPIEPVSDAPIYHVPFAVEWVRSGWLSLVPTPFGDAAASYFPANGELWLAWLLTAGADNALVKTAQWPFMILGALALFTLARQSGAPPAAAVFPPVLWSTLPLTLSQAGIANVDLIWSAFYLVAVYFLLRFLHSQAEDWRVLWCLALACGIVAGTKTVGAVFVALLLVPTVRTTVQRRRSAVPLAILTFGVLVPSAFWYTRNLWLTGNPLYPIHVSVLGFTVVDGWYSSAAMRVSAYHLPVSDVAALFTRLRVIAGSAGLLLLLGGMLAGWVLAARSETVSARRTLFVSSALALGQVAIYWLWIPYNTQERFILAALGLALVPLAVLVARWPFTGIGLCAALAWQLLAVTVGPEGQWFSVIRVFDNPLSLGDVPLALLLPVAIGAGIVLVQRWGRPGLVVASLIVAISAYLSVRPALQAQSAAAMFRNVTEGPGPFYPSAGFAARLLPAWLTLEHHAPPDGANVAYTGTNLPYYLRGIGLRNTVCYININAHPDWWPHDYHRALVRSGLFRLSTDPYPQWFRADADFDAWLANLRGRQIQFVFAARENRHGRVDPYPGRIPEFPIEKRWADAHPQWFEDLGPFDHAPGGVPWARVYRLRLEQLNPAISRSRDLTIGRSAIHRSADRSIADLEIRRQDYTTK